MKLVYRGVPYIADKPKSTAVVGGEAIRQDYVKVLKPHFPYLQYLKQLLQRSESKPVINPVTFWYHHQRQYLNFCWLLDELEALERCWNLTLINERKSTTLARPKLKYRGVTYYR